MTPNHQIQIHAIPNLHSNINDKSKVKVLSQYDLNKPNNYFECLEEDKYTRLFVDIDNHSDYKGSKWDIHQNKFTTVDGNILKHLINGFPNCSIIHASYYKLPIRNKRGDIIDYEHKLSYRITDPTLVCFNMNICKQVCLNHFYNRIKKCLGEYFKYIEIDSSVYRRGKMSCCNSYKYEHEKDRTKKLVHGEIEDTFIQPRNFDESKYEEIIKEDNIGKYVPKPTPKKDVEKATTEVSKGKGKKRCSNNDAMPPNQMKDLLLNYLKNDVVSWDRYFLIGSTTAQNGYEFEIFDEWCKLSPDYNNKCDNLNDWNYWVNSFETMSIGTIINLLKKKPEAYKNYMEKYEKKKEPKITLEQLKSPFDIIEHLKPFLFRRIRYSNKIWYVFNNHTTLWEKVPNIQYVLHSIIKKLCENQIQPMKKKLKKLEKTNDDSDSDSDDDNDDAKEIKKLKKNIKKWESAKLSIEKHSKKMQTYCETELLDNDFEEKLDQNIGFLVFKDCKIHIETRTKTSLTYDDYLTKTIPFPYEEPNEEDIKSILNDLLKIMNNDQEQLIYCLMILGYALTGYASLEQIFWVFYGSNGSNGKSILFEIVGQIFTPYVVCGNTKMLQDGSNKEHKSIPNAANARIAWFNEVPKENKINTSLIKMWRDGNSIKNEVLFGTEKTIRINSKMFIISNHQINFGKDGGINRSIVQVPFNSRFEDNLEEEDPQNLYFKKDKNILTKFINRKYSFIELMIRYGQKYLKDKKLVKQPQSVQESTKQIIKQNDKFMNWLEQYCVFEIGESIMLKDLMEKYTSTTGKVFANEIELCNYVKMQMKRIGKYQYDRRKMKQGNQGAYKNIRFLTEQEIIQNGTCMV